AGRSTRCGSARHTAATAGSAGQSADSEAGPHSAAHAAPRFGTLPIGDRWRVSRRPAHSNTESLSTLPRQAPLLVLLMDAGPRGLGCQSARVSFQAKGGYFFARNQHKLRHQETAALRYKEYSNKNTHSISKSPLSKPKEPIADDRKHRGLTPVSAVLAKR